RALLLAGQFQQVLVGQLVSALPEEGLPLGRNIPPATHATSGKPGDAIVRCQGARSPSDRPDAHPRFDTAAGWQGWADSTGGTVQDPTAPTTLPSPPHANPGHNGRRTRP